MADAILRLLTFYGELGRPLTAIEIWRLSEKERNEKKFESFLAMLDAAVKAGLLQEEEGFFSLKKLNLRIMDRKRQDLLLDKKWKKTISLAYFFKFLPFVEFVMIHGSMALATVTSNSDFDVLIGVRAGRIFTARYITLFVFSLLGARRPDDVSGSGPDKFCFNHFVTEAAFAKPPFNYYRRELYKTMIPIYGKRTDVLKFIKANAWAGLNENSLENLRYKEFGPSRLKIFAEKLLSGVWGEFLENLLRSIAVRRLSAYIKKRTGGRAVIDEAELEFHFNLSREKKFANLKI